ncbi:hypothetical protein GF337_03375 [candidate division KSB1 bacterium]|nr:hypothetical protein [candidate division KSB1 bacterium]
MKKKFVFRIFISMLIILFVNACDRAPDSSLFVETKNSIHFRTVSSSLVIDKNPWKLTVFDKSGKMQTSEVAPPAFKINDKWITVGNVGYIEQKNDRMAELKLQLRNGADASATVEKMNNHVFKIKIKTEAPVTDIRGSFSLANEEEVYGFGEMWNGRVAQRGQKIRIWDQTGTPDECAYMPYYVTTNNYAFFLNYGGLVNFDVGASQSDQIVYEAPTSRFDVTIFSGESIAGTVNHFVQHVGKPLMPPRWAFKPWYWLMGSAWDANDMQQSGHAHVIAAQKYQEMDIPVSVTWFEPKWQTARNSFITPKSFSSDVSAVIDTLHKMGIKVLGWTAPYTTSAAPNWNAAIENGFLVKKPDGELVDPKVTTSGEVVAGGYHYIDFTNPAARSWWQSEIAKGLDVGLDGYKMDSGQYLPEDAILHNGELGKDYHNSYGLYYKMTFYEILSERLDNDFMMLPRAAWVGSQKYTNFKWPGDLSASFAENGLPSSVYSSLSLTFCGMPFLSTDIGGFENRPPTEHVWIRWAQFGTFLPGMQTLAMPYWYSDEAIQHYRYLSWLHTELVPFWMSLAHEAHETGAPLVRPLVWTFQDDKKSWHIKDQFTVGDAFLVAPVITPEHRRQVYLPPGNWYNFSDDAKKWQGSAELSWEGDLWQFPVYIREGAILPLEVRRDITGFGWRESKNYITIAIWPDRNNASTFVLHDQEKPVNFTMTQSNDDWKISWSPSEKDYLFRIHGEYVNPQQLVYNDNELKEFDELMTFRKSHEDGWYFDTNQNKLWIRKTATNKSTTLWVK